MSLFTGIADGLQLKKLGWITLRAEIVEADDEKLMEESLAENLERDEISDYEKALIFDKMNKACNRTYDYIGNKFGISKQHVASYISMLKSVSDSDLVDNRKINELLYEISEHHARILNRVPDPKLRATLLDKIIREKLSVRELTNIVSRLRSWFANESSKPLLEDTPSSVSGQLDQFGRWHLISFVWLKKVTLKVSRAIHLFGSGYSLFSSHSQFDRFEDTQALSREQQWFYKIMPKVKYEIEDLKTTMLGRGAALCTMKISYEGHIDPIQPRSIRGSLVLVRKKAQWKILHEHWSKVDESEYSLQSQSIQYNR